MPMFGSFVRDLRHVYASCNIHEGDNFNKNS